MKKANLELLTKDRVCDKALSEKPHSHEKTEAFWINSPEHNNCFWEYIYKNSNKYGVLKELTTQEMAQLLGWTTSKTLSELKVALESLKHKVGPGLELKELLKCVELSKKSRN